MNAMAGHVKRTSRNHLTVADLCAELDISRKTFYEWRAKRTAPRCVKLPNGELRIRRCDFEDWMDSRQEAA
jgi:predicted DNA-binding transcriptional regulator AlpA